VIIRYCHKIACKMFCELTKCCEIILAQKLVRELSYDRLWIGPLVFSNIRFMCIVLPEQPEEGASNENGQKSATFITFGHYVCEIFQTQNYYTVICSPTFTFHWPWSCLTLYDLELGYNQGWVFAAARSIFAGTVEKNR